METLKACAAVLKRSCRKQTEGGWKRWRTGLEQRRQMSLQVPQICCPSTTARWTSRRERLVSVVRV